MPNEEYQKLRAIYGNKADAMIELARDIVTDLKQRRPEIFRALGEEAAAISIVHQLAGGREQ